MARFFVIVALGIVLGLTLFAYPPGEARAGLVTCGLSRDDPKTPFVNESVPCTMCDLFIVGNNVFNFLVVQVALPLFILVVIVSGTVMLFAGANPSLKQRARGIFEAAIIGLAIVLLSWVIVNTLIVLFAGSDQPTGFPWPWHTPACSSPYTECMKACTVKCTKLIDGWAVSICQQGCDQQCIYQ